MEEITRKTGIDVIDAVPWGTHLCQFYRTKRDLIDILVPYFKAGLENNESCIWVTSKPLDEKEAKEAMRKAVPDFDRCLKRGQIEVIPHTEWYLKDSAFNSQRVLNAWVGKLDQALAKDYAGIRVTGNTAWLEKRDWRNFIDYEAKVNNVIGNYRMLAICSYSLDKCGASEVIDVVDNHQFTLTRRAGDLVLIESPGCRHLQHDLDERNKELECLYGVSNITERLGITLDELCQEVTNLLPQGWQYPGITCARIVISGKEFKTENWEETEWKQSSDMIVHGAKTGIVEIGYLEPRPEIDEGPFLKEERLLVNDVAERLGVIVKGKRAEEGQVMISPATSGGDLTILQERVDKSNPGDIEDLEAIELILGLCLPYRDCKKLAKKCIKQFKNLRGFMSASPHELQQVGLTPRCIFCIELMHKIPVKVLKEKIIDKPVYECSQEFFDYLNYSMRDLEKEVFKVIYLNNQNQIMDTVDLFEGTQDSMSIRPREIVESSIEHGATGLIFAHNHPSGDPTPSQSDKQLTRDLVFIGNILQIRVLDHIIIGGNNYFSFAGEGLIEKYQDSFLNLRIRGIRDITANYSLHSPRLSVLYHHN